MIKLLCWTACCSQVEGIIRFDDKEPLLVWDGQVQNVCHKVDAIITDIQAAQLQRSA